MEREKQTIILKQSIHDYFSINLIGILNQNLKVRCEFFYQQLLCFRFKFLFIFVLLYDEKKDK